MSIANSYVRSIGLVNNYKFVVSLKFDLCLVRLGWNHFPADHSARNLFLLCQFKGQCRQGN